MGGLLESTLAIVGAILGAICFVVFLWPVLLALIVWALLSREAYMSDDERFTVTEGGLIEALVPSEIESRELMDAPLGGASPLPFGHLNPVWRTLLESMTPDSTIWTFSTVWDQSEGSQLVEGYVVRTGAEIGAYMITSQRQGPKRIDLVNPPRKPSPFEEVGGRFFHQILTRVRVSEA
jgi:hypothetical protein